MIWNLESGIWNKRPLSIYLHVPFCTRLCPYCHFYRVPAVPGWQDYLDAVIREVETLDIPDGLKVRTFYAGGGTPTLMPPEFYRSLFRELANRFDISGLAEATIETDCVTRGRQLAGIAEAGFDRVSIGVKSFDRSIRTTLGAGDLRDQDPVALARSAGFSSVGLDLIYGIGGQNMKDFTDDLGRAVFLDPDHISLYMLEGSEAGPPSEGDPDLAAAMYMESLRTLVAAGYRQYEISNFSKDGRQSLHNTVYWEDGDYIGLGPSAHSSAGAHGIRVRWHNRPDVDAYLTDPSSTREVLSSETGVDRAREALIMALRMTKGINRRNFALRYGFDPLELLKPDTAELKRLGLIRFSSQRVRLTPKGMLLSNEVFVRILDRERPGT